MPFKYLPDVAIADIAFEATGKDLSRLFEAAALAIADITADTKTVQSKVKKQLKVQAESIERLLYDFLTELLVIKDAQGLIFNSFAIRVSAEQGRCSLEAIARGDKIDYRKQNLRNDVKAITMHMFAVKKVKAGWKATVVVDI